MPYQSIIEFTSDGLEVTFRSETPTEAAILYVNWDFGFSGSPTSNAKYPTPITFPAKGKYKIFLGESTQMFDPEGSGPPPYIPTATVELIIDEVHGANFSIGQLVKAGLSPEMVHSEIVLNNLIRKWQLFLQSAIYPEISDENLFNESEWPYLVNILISKLVLHDLILKAASLAMTAYTNTSLSTSTTSNKKGPVKRIETGPSSAEWYDSSTFWSSMFKGAADNPGVFGLLVAEICMYADRVKVELPMCLKRKKTHLFLLSNNC